MNQAQRNFLIKKIEEETKKQVQALNSSKKESPELKMWLLHYILSDKFELQPPEVLREAIKKLALENKSDRYNWLNSRSWGDISANYKIELDVRKVVVMPKEFEEEAIKVREHNQQLYAKISEIEAQSNALILRIQLASDKTLQQMINDIDDMGNLSLMDTKLKALTA